MRALLAVLACVVAAAAALFALCSDDTDSPPAAGDRPAAPAVPVEGATREGRRPRATPPNAPDKATVPAGPGTGPKYDAVYSGVVRLPSGDPVPGALVTYGEAGSDGPSTRTDAEGRFELGTWKGSRPQPFTAFAVVGGAQHYASVKHWWPEKKFTLELVRLPSMDQFTFVRVVGHDGRAAPSASVELVLGTSADGKLQVLPDVIVADGRFMVRTSRFLADGSPIQFGVARPVDAEGRRLPFGPHLVTVPRGGGDEVVVRLPPEAVIVGRVEAPDGTPLAGTTVWSHGPWPHGYDAAAMVELSPDRVVTASDGTFRIGGLAHGEAKLVVEASPPLHVGAVATVATGAATPVVLRCAPAVATVVIVVDEAGAPLAGIGVRRDGAHDEETTDGEGRVQFVSTAPGAGRITVDGSPERERVAVDLAPAGTTQTVRLRRSGPVSGIVMGPDGQRAPSIDICLERQSTGGERAGRPGPFFIADVPCGVAFNLSVRGPRGTWIDLPVPADAPRDNIVVHLPDPGADLAVYVVGTKNPGTIRVLREGRELACSESAMSLEYFTIAPEHERVDIQVGPDSVGNFAIVRNVPSRGFLRVTPNESARRIGGTVKSHEGGGVPYAEIVVTAANGYRATAKADHAGEFSFHGAPAGRCTVAATWQHRRGQVEIDAPSDKLAIVLD